MTYGLILVFEELRSIMLGNDVHGVAAPDWLGGTVPLGDVMTYPTYRFFISAVCITIALGLYIVLSRTRLGMMIRAGASNREMVQAMGVNIKFLYRIVFAAGVALALLFVFAGASTLALLVSLRFDSAAAALTGLRAGAVLRAAVLVVVFVGIREKFTHGRLVRREPFYCAAGASW